ncbi:cobalamin biosynthesis protein CobG [Streptomyces sodiiphilus]
MSTAPRSSSPPAAPAGRNRGDACPGSLRLHAADDGALARVRVPGGVLTAGRAEALAEAALRLGDGELHLTSRGNVQLRGLRDGCGAELAGLLEAAGLLPSRAHERVRNIVASPLSGLDGRGYRDVRPWLTALDEALCRSRKARALSGRFLFALDDGRGDVAGLGADVTVRAVSGGGALLGLGRSGEAWLIPGQEASRAALVAAEIFVDLAGASGTQVWRVDELFSCGTELPARVREALTAGGIAVAVRDAGRPGAAGGPSPGVVGEAAAVAVHAPLGRLTALQWRELTRLASLAPAGELRLTPWRGVVVPTAGMGSKRVAEWLGRLLAAGLVTGPGSPWLRVGACIGRPGCARSLADVRKDAARALGAVPAQGPPLYWSGCERRCGRPPGDRIDAVAVPGGGYRLSTTGPDGAAHSTFLDDPSRLAAALAEITP